MEITTKHAKSERVTSRKHMEERLLFGGIALQTGDVPSGNQQGALPVETHLAYAATARFYQTPVATGKAANSMVGRRLHDVPGLDVYIECLSERRGEL